MNEIVVIIAGFQKVGKSKLIDTIANHFGDDINKYDHTTEMNLKGTDTRIVLKEYNLYMPYLEGPCILIKDDPFASGRSDIFYFLVDNNEVNSYSNLSIWLVLLKEKQKEIKVFDMNQDGNEEKDDSDFPIVHPRLQEYIGQVIPYKPIDILEIKDDLLKFINRKGKEINN